MKSSLRHFHLKKKSLCLSHLIPQHKICMIPLAPPRPWLPSILSVALSTHWREVLPVRQGWAQDDSVPRVQLLLVHWVCSKALAAPTGGSWGFPGHSADHCPWGSGSWFRFLFHTPATHKDYRHLLWLPKEPACHCRRHKRLEIHLWIRKIPWRRAWQPTPVFWPGESQGHGRLQSIGSQKSWTWLKHLGTHTHTLWLQGLSQGNRGCGCGATRAGIAKPLGWPQSGGFFQKRKHPHCCYWVFLLPFISNSGWSFYITPDFTICQHIVGVP